MVQYDILFNFENRSLTRCVGFSERVYDRYCHVASNETLFHAPLYDSCGVPALEEWEKSFAVISNVNANSRAARRTTRSNGEAWWLGPQPGLVRAGFCSG